MPKPWKDAPQEILAKVKGVCFDIDDTFSSEGKIHENAFSALWALKKAGYCLVPVTGRPAGWCDHIARFWPVDAVVGENGAFSFLMEDKKRKAIYTPNSILPADAKNKVQSLGKKVQKAFPGVSWASDQAYREFDLAIDFSEDVETWEKEKIKKLVKFCQKEGAQVKVSSIHVNTWFGDFDKIKGIRHLFEHLKEKKVDFPNWDEWIYIGDSPNDEPAFEAFPLSVGVANLMQFLNEMEKMPQWITPSPAGDGFSEFSKSLIASKGPIVG
jgi:HAD superfamily hydrolase (TIGR01484 family)